MTIKPKIQEIVNNADNFTPFKPETFLTNSRFMFILEENNGNKVIVVISNSTNEVELGLKNPKNSILDRVRLDISSEENNLLCITFEKIISKIRIEQREKSIKLNTKKLECTKKDREIVLDVSAIRLKKRMQKMANDFLNEINFNNKKRKGKSNRNRRIT